MTRRFDGAHRMVHLRCIINNSIPVYERSRWYHVEVSIFREVGTHIISNKKQGERVVRASRDINVPFFYFFFFYGEKLRTTVNMHCRKRTWNRALPTHLHVIFVCVCNLVFILRY